LRWEGEGGLVLVVDVDDRRQSDMPSLFSAVAGITGRALIPCRPAAPDSAHKEFSVKAITVALAAWCALGAREAHHPYLAAPTAAVFDVAGGRSNGVAAHVAAELGGGGVGVVAGLGIPPGSIAVPNCSVQAVNEGRAVDVVVDEVVNLAGPSRPSEGGVGSVLSLGKFSAIAVV
jgi:hypothetical protein